MKILTAIEQEPTPKGKRSIKRSVYGNLNGYVSGRYWVTFGESYDPNAEEDAEAWLRNNEEEREK